MKSLIIAYIARTSANQIVTIQVIAFFCCYVGIATHAMPMIRRHHRSFSGRCCSFWATRHSRFIRFSTSVALSCQSKNTSGNHCGHNELTIQLKKWTRTIRLRSPNLQPISYAGIGAVEGKVRLLYRVDDPMRSMVAIRRSADSCSGASIPSARYAPLNSSISEARERMSGVILMASDLITTLNFIH